MSLNLTPEDIAAVADAVVARLQRAPRSDNVMTLAEACAYAKKGSPAAFYRWTKAHSVQSCGHGRYTRRALDRGLEREAFSCRPRRSAA
jgi:hypothetical protein